MLTCKQAASLISQSQDRPLSRSEKWRLRLHLCFCPHCRRYEKQLDTIRSSMRQMRDEQK
ncbi:zf-HC2 domain-containing protein [Neisseria shayeganii]|uniref:Zf-HC2 domain-containing protein n=1 Tax=Neisseria shayeganii TaxID=607712 RepID=A0A7D7N5D0_9NEIS|nr:zf-HC2 domain-containing protein [Neisseria shayeganii]QMT40500.1 zf-HC2 domain-containing protein [Neisseria shayeganii]